MSISDAQWQQWLERSGKYRCALFELTFFGAEAGSPSVGGEHQAYVGNYPYVTRGTDTPAHQEFDWCVLEAPSFTRRMGEQLEGRSTQSYGDLILSNEATLGDQGQLLEAGARDDWLSMNWDGRRVRMWLGDPSWPFADFRLVLDGRIVDVYDPGGYKIGFRIGDKAALLDRPIMTTVLDGDGPAAGQLMPLAYGYTVNNIRPRLIDQTDQIYRISQTDPGVEELYDDPTSPNNPFRVRENGVSLSGGYELASSDAGTDLLTVTAHGMVANTRIRFVVFGPTDPPAPLVEGTDYWVISSGLTANDFKVAATRGGSAIDISGAQTGLPVFEYYGWDYDASAGTFQLAGNPAGLITCDVWGLTVLAGSPPLPDQIVTAGDIIYQVLTSTITNTPLTSADIDGASLAAFVALCPQPLSIYITERMTFADLLDRLVLSVGGWWGFSREGLLQFGRLDLPEAGTPVYSFTTDDTARRSMKMLRRILPRAEVKLRGQINWNPQDTVAGSVDSYERAYYANPYTETTGAVVPVSWEDDPANHLSALRPEPFSTLLCDPTEQQDESDRLAVLFQKPNSIMGFDTHQAVYLLKIGDLLYNEHPKFTGYATVVGLTERIKGRSQVEFFCRKTAVHASASIPEAGVEVGDDWFLAEFTGTGDLTAYAPDVGADLAVRSTPANLFVGNPGATGGLAAAVRNADGSWEFYSDNGIEPNDYALKVDDTPPSANYRQSITLLLPGTDTVQVSVALVGRGYVSIYDPNVLNGIAARFDVAQSDNTHRSVDCFRDRLYDDDEPIFDDNPFETVSLGAAASVTLAAEFDGSTLRAYVDGVLIYTVTWSGSTEFDAAGILEWQFNFFDTGDPYTTVAVDTMIVSLL